MAGLSDPIHTNEPKLFRITRMCQFLSNSIDNVERLTIGKQKNIIELKKGN